MLLQYCGQPGVLLHHSHRGAVQQSKWKHQAGYQGQGGCMTETLDFIIFMLMNRKTIFSTTFIYGVFQQQRRGIDGKGVAQCSFLCLCGNGATTSPWLSCRCHGYEPSRGTVGWFLRWCFLFKYLYFDTVHVSSEKKGNTEPILFILQYFLTRR